MSKKVKRYVACTKGEKRPLFSDFQYGLSSSLQYRHTFMTKVEALDHAYHSLSPLIVRQVMITFELGKEVKR